MKAFVRNNKLKPIFMEEKKAYATSLLTASSWSNLIINYMKGRDGMVGLVIWFGS